MSSRKNLFLLASKVLNTPLLITQAKLNAILGFLGLRVGLTQGGVPGESQPSVVAQSMPMEVVAEDPSVPLSGIGILRIFGTLVHRSKGFEGASGILGQR
jgi:hypothetical protein